MNLKEPLRSWLTRECGFRILIISLLLSQPNSNPNFLAACPHNPLKNPSQDLRGEMGLRASSRLLAWPPCNHWTVSLLPSLLYWTVRTQQACMPTGPVTPPEFASGCGNQSSAYWHFSACGDFPLHPQRVRWHPLGELPTHRVCGDIPQPSSSWCSPHASTELAWDPVAHSSHHSLILLQWPFPPSLPHSLLFLLPPASWNHLPNKPTCSQVLTSGTAFQETQLKMCVHILTCHFPSGWPWAMK